MHFSHHQYLFLSGDPEKRFCGHKSLECATYSILGFHSVCQYLQSSAKSYTKDEVSLFDSTFPKLTRRPSSLIFHRVPIATPKNWYSVFHRSAWKMNESNTGLSQVHIRCQNLKCSRVKILTKDLSMARSNFAAN